MPAAESGQVRAESQQHRVDPVIRSGDSVELRKERGAFFTPARIADYLAEWAVGGDPEAKVLDPTCGEAVFLSSAGRLLRALGRDAEHIGEQLYGVDPPRPALLSL